VNVLFAWVIIVGLIFCVVIVLASRARVKYSRLRKQVQDIDFAEARTRWKTAALDSENWKGSYFNSPNEEVLSSTGVSAEIEFAPANLVIGNANYNPADTLAGNFRILGAIGDDDLAWICSRNDETTIWELDGTENQNEQEKSRFPSIYHYLLFIHLYYEKGQRD
jgi:hypothetical protein